MMSWNFFLALVAGSVGGAALIVYAKKNNNK